MIFYVLFGITQFLGLIVMMFLEYQKALSIYETIQSISQNRVLSLLHNVFLIYLCNVFTRWVIYGFLGKIRSDEIAYLNDQCLYYVTDIILMVSLFQDNLTAGTLLLFVFMLHLKSVGWILEQRMTGPKSRCDYALGFAVLAVSHSFYLAAFQISLLHRNIQILFCFEFFKTYLKMAKVMLLSNLGELPEDFNRLYSCFCADMAIIGTSLLGTLVFFIATTVNLRLPFNVFRDIFRFLHILAKKIRSFRNLKRVYSNLSGCPFVHSGTCPICREEMEEGRVIKCGHSFHMECIKKWAEKQQVCPICRMEMFRGQNVVKIETEGEFISAVQTIF